VTTFVEVCLFVAAFSAVIAMALIDLVWCFL